MPTARLELKEGEAEKFTQQLNAVLEKAQILGTKYRGPCSYNPSLPLSNVLRRDEEGGSFPGTGLGQRPRPFSGLLPVPRIIE